MIRLSCSDITEEEKKAVNGVMTVGYLGMGSTVGQFEDELTNFFGVSTVCVNSGTAALHLALEAIGISGKEVLVPALTYVATFQAITAAGGIPVPCDVSKTTGMILTDEISEKINHNTIAILPVLFAGISTNLDEIYNLAKSNNLSVIIDAAHAFGGTFKGKPYTDFCDACIYSFDGIKNITCGEGGAITSKNDSVIETCRDTRLLGVQKDSINRVTGQRTWQFDVIHQGYRYHMSEINAAIGRVQLNRFPEFQQRRTQLLKCYIENFKNNGSVSMLEHQLETDVPHIAPVSFNNAEMKKKVQSKLTSVGIQTGQHYFPNHFLTKFKNPNKLKNVECFYENSLTIPLHTKLTNDEQKLIIETINSITL